MIAALLASLAVAAVPEYPVTMVGMAGGSAGPPSFGGLTDGRLVIYPGPSPIGLEVAGREGFFVQDSRTVGAIAVQARWPTPSGLYLRGGFVHHHETPWALASTHVFEASMGSLRGIRHRTGLEIGGGLDLTIPDRTLKDRLGVVLDASVSAFPDKNGPPLYAFLEAGVTIDVGKSRRPLPPESTVPDERL